MQKNALEWNGMEWNGMEWNGMEWNGMECIWILRRNPSLPSPPGPPHAADLGRERAGLRFGPSTSRRSAPFGSVQCALPPKKAPTVPFKVPLAPPLGPRGDPEGTLKDSKGPSDPSGPPPVPFRPFPSGTFRPTDPKRHQLCPTRLPPKTPAVLFSGRARARRAVN